MELHFDDPDEPYRLHAELREALSAEELLLVELVPSPDGPALRISDALRHDRRLGEVLERYEATVTS